jgi:hypothetical protein
MKDKLTLTDIRIAMDKSVFKDQKFSPQHKQEIMKKIKRKKNRTEWFPRSLSVAFTIVLVISGVYLISEELNDSFENEEPSLVPDLNGEVSPPSEPSLEPGLNVEITPPSLSEGDNEELFELSSVEEQAYSNFQNDLDLGHLSGLEPISVAKLYIYAGYYKDTEVQYALYTDRKDRIQWSKEEDENFPDSDRATEEQTLTLFKDFEKGAFVKTGEYEGYIEFEAGEDSEAKSGFKMIQNEGGIWQVAFMPIQ